MEVYHIRWYTFLLVLDFLFSTRSRGYAIVAERYPYRFFFFWRGGQLLVAEWHNHRFDFFLKTVVTRGMLYCSHYHLKLCYSVQHRLWMGTVFLLRSYCSLSHSHVQISLPSSLKKASFHKVNMEWSNSTSLRQKLRFIYRMIILGTPELNAICKSGLF